MSQATHKLVACNFSVFVCYAELVRFFVYVHNSPIARGYLKPSVVFFVFILKETKLAIPAVIPFLSFRYHEKFVMAGVASYCVGRFHGIPMAREYKKLWVAGPPASG